MAQYTTNSLGVHDSKYYPYPDDTVSPKEKLEYSYGLRYSMAIFHNTQNYGSPLFFNNRKDYWELIDYSQGAQSEDKYMPLLKINPKDRNNTTWVGALRWAIKNYATKRLNIVLSKVSEREYEPIINAVDQGSLDERDEVRSKMKAYMDNRELAEYVSSLVGQNFTPEEVDPELMPETTDELDLWMNTSYKERTSASLEKLVRHHVKRNKYDNIKRLTAYDTFVFGIECAYAGMDINVLPELYHCNPFDILVPPSKYEDFRDIPFVGHMLRPTISEFRKMIGNEFGEDFIKKIIDDQVKTSTTGYKYTQTDYNSYSYNDIPRMELMRFCFKSTDEMVHVARNDNYGNSRLMKKRFEEYRTGKDAVKFQEKYKGKRKLMRTPHDTVYEGYWIVGTDVIFRYGMRSFQERPRGNMGQSSLPYKLFAPNMKNNRTVSTMRQMIPVLDELQSYHVKKQHAIANALPQVWSIDLNALRNAQFKWNNKNMSDQDKIGFLFQTGIFLFDASDRFLPGNNYQPIREMKTNSAQEVLVYIQLIASSLEELDEIIGFNKVTSAGTLRPDTLKGTAEIQERSSEISLDYLYKADREITSELYKSMAILTLQSVKYRKDGYYEAIIGERATKELRAAKKKDYGYNIEPHPTASEWEQLYIEALEAMKNGNIGWDDYLDLKSITNLKEARQVFKVRVRKRDKASAQSEQAKIDSTLQGQSQSNVQAHENQTALEEMKSENEMKKLEMEGKLKKQEHIYKMRELEKEFKLKGVNEEESDVRKGVTELVKIGEQSKSKEKSGSEKN